MSWLKKIVSKICAQSEQVAEEVLNAMPAAQCPTAESVATVSAPAAENPTKQRRYFVKRGLFVDHEDEVAAARAVESKEEILDRRPVDLKTLFPKLSLR
jgi:hypothetical protein